MRPVRIFALAISSLAGFAGMLGLPNDPLLAKAPIAVGAQYDTTRVYIAPEDFDHFVDSIIATFGGVKLKRSLSQITPTPSRALSQIVLTPVGNFAVFGFKTPIPYPFGREQIGYSVSNIDTALANAKSHGAGIIVTMFPSEVGSGAIVQWPGGVQMQFSWHATPPTYDALKSLPEDHVYVPPEQAQAFVTGFVEFADAKVVSDDKQAPGLEIGRPNDTYRRIRIDSGFGKLTVLATDGQLPYPYGREQAGYEVVDLASTLDKAKAAGADVLVEPYIADDRRIAIVQFPGGYIAEIHSSVRK